MPSSAPRMVDIAERLNISVVTVSKALAGKDGVGIALREQILKTAIEMGYQRKNRADANSDSTFTIGILLTERLRKPEHSFYWALCMSLIDMLKNQQYYNILEIVKLEQEHSSYLPDFIARKKVDGVMVLGSIGEIFLKSLADTGIPLVLLDYYSNSLNTVSVIPDNFLGGYSATRHLLSKGHTKIGFVGSIDVNNNAQDRYYGYCKALSRHGIEVRSDWIIPNRTSGGFMEEFDLPDELPTAFFCDCDQGAYNFVHDLQHKGYNIPNDISIIGFYDYIYATLVEPGLTSYRIGIKTMAERAAAALISIINKEENIPERIIITGGIVERDSVRDLRG